MNFDVFSLKTASKLPKSPSTILISPHTKFKRIKLPIATKKSEKSFHALKFDRGGVYDMVHIIHNREDQNKVHRVELN
jgi:alpha-N-acetylglucosamine transferase